MSLDVILKCDHSNDSYCNGLSVDSVCVIMLYEVCLTFESVGKRPVVSHGICSRLCHAKLASHTILSCTCSVICERAENGTACFSRG